MNEFILYLLKASLGIIIFYLVYWTFLRKETFFNANRIFLISSLLASVILPLIGFTYITYVSSTNNENIFVELNKNIQSISDLGINANSNSSGINWQNILLTIYLSGLIIFLLRLVWQSIELLVLVIKNGITPSNGMSIVENNKYGLPFSFFNIVFINPKFHFGTDLTNILAHEKVHIRENHWFDLFIVELFTVIFWFNPFVWLFERSIKQNHEYLADEGVLAQGFSVGRYQAILLNQLMGMQIIGITNNLNYSLNKKRMKMMTKIKTPKIRAYKIFLALPAVALLILAFAKPAYVVETKSNPTIGSSSNISQEKLKIEAKVLDDEGKPVEGASVVIYGKSEGTLTDVNGVFSLLVTRTDRICISYIGYTTQVKLYNDFEQTKSGSPTTISLIRGVIKLDIDEILKKGKPEETSSTETNSKENKSSEKEVYTIVEALPEYPGGLYAFAKEIKEKTGTLDFSGKVEIGFTVENNGNLKIYQINLGSNVSEEFSKKLLNILYSTKKWTPGQQRGKVVPVTYSITLNFK